MQPATVARWSAQNSLVHQLDARVKLVVLLSFICSVALIRQPSAVQYAAALLLLLLTLLAARLPWMRLVARSLLVVPFVGPLAAIIFIGGDHGRALTVLGKTYLSAFAVLLAVSTTALPRLLESARWFHVPSMLIEVTALIYRYLFVLLSEVQQTRVAFSARSGRAGLRAFIATAGTVAVLFERSYRRAESLHHAMLARGFTGSLPVQPYAPLRMTDYACCGLGIATAIGLHFLPH